MSGTSNEPLARAIAKHLNLPLGDVEITRFIDSECRVWVKEDVAGKHVFVIQSLSTVADQNLMELCLLGQAVKSLKASRVTAVIPWMGYSKQDKAFRKGEAVSAELVARFIEVAGFDAVISVELHSENIIPYFTIPLREISTHELFAQELLAKGKRDTMVVASPDMGGKARSERFARFVGLPIVYIEKKRDLATGKVTVSGISESVAGRDVIIYDDIINTGATVIKTGTFLKEHGSRSVQFLATHGVFAGDSRQNIAASSIDRVVVTDTIVQPKAHLSPKFSVISIATLLARAIGDASR